MSLAARHRTWPCLSALLLAVAAATGCARETITSGYSRVGVPLRFVDARTNRAVPGDDPRIDAVLHCAGACLPVELPEALAPQAAKTARNGALPDGALQLSFSAVPEPATGSRFDRAPQIGSRTVYNELLTHSFRPDEHFSGDVCAHVLDLRGSDDAAFRSVPLLIDLSLSSQSRKGAYRFTSGLAEALAERARAIVADCAAEQGLRAVR